MRIDRIKVVRFGEFTDREVDDLRPGLNLLFGPNEAGKSTLLGSIRFLLFGAAFKGYEAGEGRLVEATLWREDCKWTLSRKDGKGKGAFQLRPAEGGPPVLVPDFSRDWLGGTSLATYKSVYALGLDDLKLDSEVQDLILEHADPLGHRLRQAIAETAKSAEGLLAPAAQKPINAALGEWKGANDEVLRLSQQPQELNEKEQALRAAQEQVGRLDAETQELGRQQEQCQEALDARDAWEQAVILRRQCEALSGAADFPPTAVPEFQAAKQRGQEARVRAEEAREQADVARRQLESSEINPVLLAEGERVEKLAEEAAPLHDLPVRLQEAEQKAAAADRAAREEAVARCGRDVSTTALRALDTSAAVQSELDAHAASLGQAGVSHQQAGAAVRAAALADARARDETKEAEESLRALPPPADLAALRARAERLEEWQRIHAEYRLALGRQEAARERHDTLAAQRGREMGAHTQAEAQARVWEDSRSRLEKGNAGALLRRRVVCAVAGILLLAGGLAAPALGQPLWAPYLFAGAAFFLLLLATSRPPAPAMIQPLPPLPAVTVTPEQVQEAEAALGKAGAAVSALQARLSEAAASMALPESAGEGEVRQRSSDLKAQAEATQADAIRRTQVETQLRAARDRQKRAAEDLRHCEVEDQGARDAAEAAERSWREALLSRGIPPDFRPDGARAYLEGARVVQARLREHDERSVEAAGLRKRLDGFRGRAGALAAAIETEVAEDDPWALRAVRQWSERLKEHHDRARRQSELAATLVDAEARCRKAEADEAAAANAMRQALKRARAADEDAILRRSEAHAEWARLDGDLRQAEAQLHGLRSDEEWQAFRERLEQADWTAVQSEATSLADREQGLRDERDRALETIGHLQKEIDKLRQDEALADAQARREGARARVVELGRMWAADAVAHALLALTRARFEAERQPEAVRRTGALFAELTDGRWGDIVARDGGVSVSRPGVYGPIERDPDRLSRGARDALMLCARLAAIEQAVGRFPLPVVLDDTLVNLDRCRHERALRIIARMAERTQVLLFTCHEHTVAQLAAAGIPHHLVELGSARVELPLLPGTPSGRDERIESEGKRL